jgi:hypothetical protein
LLGFGCVLLGFIFIVLSAIDYVAGLSVDTSGFTSIGIACVVIGLYIADKDKHKTGKV